MCQLLLLFGYLDVIILTVHKLNKFLVNTKTRRKDDIKENKLNDDILQFAEWSPQ